MADIALLRYLKTTDGLPDPKGSLSSSIQLQATVQGNEEVKEGPEKRIKKMWTLSGVQCRNMSKNCENITVTAASHFFLESWISLVVRVQYIQLIKHT